ncbi:tetratricopeptide repeat protein [Microcoleus sp. K1-B6]|uniref:tetratricopeptide repeat protein n=1 Tax=unclassified Microcoleus TaxID=2642155 RepID=UPI002FD1BB81
MNQYNYVITPIFRLNENGTIKPNPLFHRPWDNLHSRCIEYPFAASQLGDAKCILDVGTVKSDLAWISWLEGLPIDVYATDYDPPLQPFNQIQFCQSDVRKLPFKDETFDKIIAVSVIEHIGLQAPQVNSPQLPLVDQSGDLEAVKELARILKVNGELIMTLPFGVKDELILGNQARNYTIKSIQKFDQFLSPIKMEYYEYKKRGNNEKYDDELPGLVNWYLLPLTQTQALHKGHTEGVICGVWKKQDKPNTNINQSLIYFDIANKIRREGNVIESIDTYTKALEYNPSSHRILLNIVEAYFKIGDFQKAIQAYRKAIKIRPKSAYHYYNLAEILIQNQQVAPAIYCLKKAIELNPNFYDLYLQLGHILNKQEKLDEAYRYYEKAIEIYPNGAEAYSGLADILSQQGSWQQSLSYYQIAIKLYPNLLTTRLKLCKTLAKFGRLEEAIASYHHTLELSPDAVEIYQPFLEVLIQKSKLDTNESANLQHPEKAETYSHQGTESLNKKNYTQALTSFYKALTLNPNLSSAYFGLGQTLKWQKLTTTAIVSFQQAIELNPNYGDYYHWLGECCVQLNKIETAIDAYQQAIKLNPKAAHPYRGLAYAYQKKDNWDEAMTLYQKSLELNPKYVLAYNQLGEALVQREEWEAAVEVYRQSLNFNQEQPNIQATLDRILSNLANDSQL